MVASHTGIWHADIWINNQERLHLIRINNGQLFSFGYHFVGIVSPPIDVAVLFIVALTVSFRRVDYRPAAMTLQTIALTSLTVLFFKFAVHRPQPMGAHPLEGSFPSGHTASAIVFGYTMVKLLAKNRNQQLAGTAAVVVLTGAMGFFLIYGRAHWLSDVLASICLGPLILEVIRRRGIDPRSPS